MLWWTRANAAITRPIRGSVQPLMVANDPRHNGQVIGDNACWQNSIGVPHDRFERRADYMARALHAVG